MRKRIAIIVNPASGRAAAAPVAREAGALFHNLGASVDILHTVYGGHAYAYAQQLCGTVDAIVSVGGDGTLNEVVNGVLDAGGGTPIGIIPAGTANVVGLELGLPRTLEGLVKVVLDGPVRAIDLGQAGERRFIMCAGVGFDAAIVDRLSRRRGAHGIRMFSYLGPIVKSALQYTFPRLTVRVDGAVVTEDATFVVVGNMRRYGGPFRLFRRAVPDDGRLDLCCMQGTRMVDLLRYAWAAWRNRLPLLPDVRYHAAREVEITASEEVLVQVDGDLGGHLPMRFAIQPARVGFCVSDLDPHGESARAASRAKDEAEEETGS